MGKNGCSRSTNGWLFSPLARNVIFMRLNAILFSLVGLLFTAGCATQPLNTVSGRPEVTVHNRTAAQVRSAAINQFMDRGYALAQSGDNQLIFAKEDSVTDQVLMGLLITGNAGSHTRITLTLVENGRDVRVVGGVTAMGQTDYGRVRSIELTGKGYQQLQGELRAIKVRAEAAN